MAANPPTIARGMPSLRESASNVASALVNFDSCSPLRFTAATTSSRATSASGASWGLMLLVLVPDVERDAAVGQLADVREVDRQAAAQLRAARWHRPGRERVV